MNSTFFLLTTASLPPHHHKYMQPPRPELSDFIAKQWWVHSLHTMLVASQLCLVRSGDLSELICTNFIQHMTSYVCAKDVAFWMYVALESMNKGMDELVFGESTNSYCCTFDSNFFSRIRIRVDCTCETRTNGNLNTMWIRQRLERWQGCQTVSLNSRPNFLLMEAIIAWDMHRR